MLGASCRVHHAGCVTLGASRRVRNGASTIALPRQGDGRNATLVDTSRRGVSLRLARHGSSVKPRSRQHQNLRNSGSFV